MAIAARVGRVAVGGWNEQSRLVAAARTMKAIVHDRYGSPEVLELAEIDILRPGPGEALVRVRAAGVDPGVWHVMAGRPYLVRAMGYGLRAPKTRVLGVDVAGTVEEVAPGLTAFAPGDEVYGTCKGSYAEFASIPIGRLAARPRNVTWEQVAAAPVSGCAALLAVRDKGEVRSGHRVLVIGASGGVGSFAVQIAKADGAHVTGLARTAKLDFVRSLGADDAIDYTREDIANGREPYDVIVDTGGNRSLLELRRALAPRGTLVLVGGEDGGGSLLGGFDRQIVRAPLLSLVVPQRLRPLMSSESPDNLAALRELIEDGKVTPAVDRVFPLVETAEAIRYLRAGRARGKVVVTPLA